MTDEIIKTPRNTIYLKVLQLAQELFGEDKVTDFEIDKDKLPMVRVDEGMNSSNNNKDMIGTVTMTVNFFSKTDFNQRNLLDSSLGRLHNALRRGELPKDDTYNIEVSGIEEPTPRYDKSTGETLLIKTLVIRLTYTKKPVDVETEPTEPIVIWAELDPIEEGSLTITGTGTPNERILIFISGGLVFSHTMWIDENGEFSYVQGYSLKGGDIVKVLRLADGKELSTYELVAEGDGDGDEIGYTPIEDFEYIGMSYGSQSVRRIGKYNGKDTKIVLPPEIEGYKVTVDGSVFRGKKIKDLYIPEGVLSLGASSFRDNIFNTGIKIPEGCSVGTYTFADSMINSIEIPKSMGNIATSAFQGNNITKLELPEGVRSIGNYSFEDNAIEELILPKGLVSIGRYTFRNNALEEVLIPPSVTTIGDYAFANNRLERVVIPPSVTSIGTRAFDNDVEIIHEDDVATQGIQAMSMQTFSVNATKEEEVEVDSSGIVIEGYRGTVAEQYAKENGHTFVALDEDE